MKIKVILSIFLFFLYICFSCAEKGTEETVVEPEKPIEEDTIIPPSSVEDTEDWLYRKNKDTGKEEKFFGIGFWHIPGYTTKQTVDLDEGNINTFKKRTSSCNIILIDFRYVQSYMNEKIMMVDNFSWAVHNYLDKTTSFQGADKDYYRIQYLKANIDNPEFIRAIDNEVNRIVTNYSNFERGYRSIDEIAVGGVSRWYIPPAVGDLIYERIMRKESNPIVFVDLLAHGRGSTFFFEQNYLKTHSSMPYDPPYELLNVSEEALAQTKIPLLRFFQAYDGTPVFKFDSNGNYSYVNLEIDRLKSIWYENVKQIAAAYKNSGNVFSINAHGDFYKHPILTGITVDALKAGLGDKPVWLYFDGNGYAKPAAVTPKDYVNCIKCQIYTSIVHGATGVFFWNDTSKTPEVFDALLPILSELNENLDIIYLPTIEKEINGDLHFMIKKDSKEKKYIIATNTSKTNTLALNIRGVEKKTLYPMEVYISAMQ